jgi:hypothetical protein
VSPRTQAPSIPDPKPAIDVEQAAKLLASGRTYVDIGEQLGYRPSSIRRRLLEKGVLRKKRASLREAKWGRKLYSVWKSMRQRAAQYGVGFSGQWRDFESFYSWARASGYRPGLVLHRKRETRDFTPSNCVWGPRRQPTGAHDTESHARRLTEAQWKLAEDLHVQDHLSCPEVARKLGVAHGTILRGLKLRGSYVRAKPGFTSTTTGYKLYKSWLHMRSRCYDPNDPAYGYYGAKGAVVCREWEDFSAFQCWALANGWEPQLCLSRHTAHAFSPTNCRWITRAEAAREADHPSSKMPPVWTLTAFNETKGPTEWSRDRRCAITLASLLWRLRRGWPPEDAISTPPQRDSAPRPKHLITAFGQTKGVTAWSKDRRCKVTLVTLLRRLERRMSPEDAITAKPFRAP